MYGCNRECYSIYYCSFLVAIPANKKALTEMDGYSACPSLWADLWAQWCSSTLCHSAHMRSQFSCNFIHTLF